MDELTEGEVSAVSSALGAVTSIIKSSSTAEWRQVSANFPLGELVKLLLDSPDARLRAEAAATFTELIQGDYTLPAADGALQPATAVLGSLFLNPAALKALPRDHANAGDYFSLCELVLACGGPWLDPRPLAAALADKVLEYHEPVRSGDSALVGTLNLAASLLERFPGCAPDALPLATQVLSRHLLKLPFSASPESIGAKVVPASSGPVCWSVDARTAACRLVAALGLGAMPVKAAVASALATFALETTAPAVDRWAEEIKAAPRPGLHNMMNRCYMNSLCQQLVALVRAPEPSLPDAGWLLPLP